MDVTSYLLGKKAGGGSKPPVLQDKKVTITENGTTNVTADDGYDGLSEVEVTTNVQPDLESKSVTITENTTTTITPTTGKDGLSQVSVTTNLPPADIGEYFKYTIEINENFSKLLKKIPSPIYITDTDWSGMFAQNNLLEIPTIVSDSSLVTSMNNMFSSSFKIESMNLSYFNTSNVTNMIGMFRYNYKLKDLDISSFNFESCTDFRFMFESDRELINLNFGYNLGKGYSTIANSNDPNYTLNLSGCNKLTHDSLMSVINGLYDIASAGVQPQQLILGSTNLAKLSQAEKDMVTAKGWNLS